MTNHVDESCLHAADWAVKRPEEHKAEETLQMMSRKEAAEDIATLSCHRQYKI